MTTKNNPLTLWWQLKEQIDTLLTIHARFPKVAKRTRGIMGARNLKAIPKSKDKMDKTIAKAEKTIVKAQKDFIKRLTPRAKEVRDSHNIVKVIMKADFPKEYAAVFGKKKAKGGK